MAVEEEEDEEDEEDEEAEALGRDLLLLLRCCACSSSVAIRAAVCWAAEPYKLVVLVQEKLLSKELEVVAVPFASAILISWRVQVMAQTNCA